MSRKARGEEPGMEGRENDVSTTKRNADKRGRAGTEKEFKLVQFSPWPLDCDRFHRSAPGRAAAPVARGQKQKNSKPMPLMPTNGFLYRAHTEPHDVRTIMHACVCVCACVYVSRR